MAKINPKITAALDNHPKLKGGQSKLPDELQAKIINTKNARRAISIGKGLSKLGAATAAKLYGVPHPSKESYMLRRHRDAVAEMNAHPFRNALVHGGIGAGVGGIVGGKRGAAIGATLGGLAGEAERRIARASLRRKLGKSMEKGAGFYEVLAYRKNT